MTKLDRLIMKYQVRLAARRYGIPPCDPRLREIENDARVLVREGAAPAEAVELAAVPILRVFGLPSPRRAGSRRRAVASRR
ncbi:MAG TPA: hypothetical protein VFL83_09005 [Anaeromyxobacter sp.]|nr:hypothetical protein [Anaeromyxobacter sp.]